MRTNPALFFIALMALFLAMVAPVQAGSGNHRTADGKLKVLYHVDGNNLATAKYAMALIKKHIEAEGGPDKIDLKLVVHGPALKLFKNQKHTYTRSKSRLFSDLSMILKSCTYHKVILSTLDQHQELVTQTWVLIEKELSQ